MADTSSRPPFVAVGQQLYQPITGPISSDEYAKLVADWQKAYSSWLQTTCNQYGAMLASIIAAPLQAASQVNTIATVNTAAQSSSSSSLRRLEERQRRQPRVIEKAAYTIPPLWKRFVAECIDSVLLFAFRLIITLLLMQFGFFKTKRGVSFSIEPMMSLFWSVLLGDDFMGEDAADNILRVDDNGDGIRGRFTPGAGRQGAGGVDHRPDLYSDSVTATIDDFVYFTSQFFVVETVSLTLYTLYEILALWKPFHRLAGSMGIGMQVGGSTFGKKVLGLKVVEHDVGRITSAENIGGAGCVIVYQARTPGFINAAIRSVIKNFSATVLFPASLTVFFYSHRLAIYDVIASTTVVTAASERDLSPPIPQVAFTLHFQLNNNNNNNQNANGGNNGAPQ